jgi:hypothetical protein
MDVLKQIVNPLTSIKGKTAVTLVIAEAAVALSGATD